MPGYSGTPLLQKLGIKPSYRVALLNVPSEVETELREALKSCQMAGNGRGPLDYIHFFVKSKAELGQKFPRLAKQLAPAGILWISWPKKTSGVVSDLDENVVRKIGLATGLVDVKVCAVSEVWSGLKFVVRKQDRPKS